MFLYFDKNGILKEIINDEATRKASTSTIFAYFEGDPKFSDIYFYIEKADGVKNGHTRPDIIEETREVPYVKDRELKFFKNFTQYKFYKYVLKSDDVNVAGVFKLTIQTFDLDSLPYAFGTYVGKIENNVITTNPSITQAEYEELKRLISLKTYWNDIEDFIGLKRKDLGNYADYTKWLQGEIFKLELVDHPTEPQRLAKVIFNNIEHNIKDYDNDIKSLESIIHGYNDFNYEIVDVLPHVGEPRKLYWLKVRDNVYDIYHYNKKWELIFSGIHFDYTSALLKTDIMLNVPLTDDSVPLNVVKILGTNYVVNTPNTRDVCKGTLDIASGSVRADGTFEYTSTNNKEVFTNDATYIPTEYFIEARDLPFIVIINLEKYDRLQYNGVIYHKIKTEGFFTYYGAYTGWTNGKNTFEFSVLEYNETTHTLKYWTRHNLTDFDEATFLSTFRVLVPKGSPTNIQIYKHNIKITINGGGRIWLETISKNNLEVNSLQDLTTLLGDNFEVSCTGYNTNGIVIAINKTQGIYANGQTFVLSEITISDVVTTI